MTVQRTNWEEATNMEPMYGVWYYIEFQKRLAASVSSERLVDVPADQQLNSLQAGQHLLGPGTIQSDTKPPGGGNPLTPLEIPDLLAVASKEMNLERSDTDSLRVERIKAALTKIALAFLLIAGLVTFALACLLSPTFLG
jgi:hypothetical protein